MVVGLLGNESSDSNRFALVNPKSENDVRLQATLANQNPTVLPVGAVSVRRGGSNTEGDTLLDYLNGVFESNISKVEEYPK